MRVAYVVGWPEGPTSGPFKKIRAQTAAWVDQGVEVGLYVFTTQQFADDWQQLPAARSVVARGSGPAVAFQKEALLRAARAWQPDVIYHRWSLTYPGLVRAMRRETVVIEINTDDVVEYDLMTPMKGRINRLTRGVVLRRASGLAFVTRELVDTPAFARYQRPSVVVANGIELAKVPQQPAPVNERPVLLFIGQPHCPWHGLDKLAYLARTEPEWEIDVVGPGAAEVRDPPPNMVFHGLLEAADYSRHLARANIGVGSLALHRKRLNEASPLKVREYLATGLPVINGYTDTDYPDGADFLLTLPNTEDNVEAGLGAIRDFVAKWSTLRVPREAVGHLDYAAKEATRLDFFRTLLPRP